MDYVVGDQEQQVEWLIGTIVFYGFLYLNDGFLVDDNEGRTLLSGGFATGDGSETVTWSAIS